jgi:hypothetical protein
MMIRLGDPKGWGAKEDFLQFELGKILEPELSSITWEQVKAQLADRAVLEWMADFGFCISWYFLSSIGLPGAALLASALV